MIAWVAQAGGGHAVLGVREDFLARLLERIPAQAVGAPIVRIGPLDIDGARDAIVRPLAERRAAIAPDLLDQLLADLTTAGARLGANLGWSAPAPVYPPHLQLACAVLYDRVPVGESLVTLDNYRALGGFDAIVGEHLERVLDGLSADHGAIARDILLSLVGPTQVRAARSDAELGDAIDDDRRRRLPVVLEILQQQGLVVRTQRPGGDLVWEIIHDSLVPRVLTWIDRRDLSRRRAVELVRYHLRRSRPGAPSLLSRGELRELSAYAGAIAQLDAEWRRAHSAAGDLGLAPAALVRRSEQAQRRSTIAGVALALAVVAGVGAAAIERWQAAAELAREAARRDRDLGMVNFELSAFDWDADRLRGIPVPLRELPGLTWTLHAPSYGQPDAPGDALPSDQVRRVQSSVASDGMVRIDAAEARGGAAFLVIDGRGPAADTCLPSVVPLRQLPGYARRGLGAQRLAIRVPTCQASRAGTIEIPAGPFVFGGAGEPPVHEDLLCRAIERTVVLGSYRIDRTEVTNAAYDMFTDMHDATGIEPLLYMPTQDVARAGDARSPASSMTWREATAYCRFLGKRLPTTTEWEKAMRGGLMINGVANPARRRNVPWGTGSGESRANIAPRSGPPDGPRAVAAFDGDRSPYGVLDLAGNVSEWISSELTGYADAHTLWTKGMRIVRGGNWSESPPAELPGYMAIENPRFADTRSYGLGLRCAVGDSQ